MNTLDFRGEPRSSLVSDRLDVMPDSLIDSGFVQPVRAALLFRKIALRFRAENLKSPPATILAERLKDVGRGFMKHDT